MSQFQRSILPQGPASAYQTFQIKTPKGPEFFRPATCEEVECDAWTYGWITRCPKMNEQLMYALKHSGRSPISMVEELDAWVFTFPPGTECFRSSVHRKAVRPDLPQLFVVRDGDWRGNPRGTKPRIHQRPEDWVEHHQEVTAKVVERIEKG